MSFDSIVMGSKLGESHVGFVGNLNIFGETVDNETLKNMTTDTCNLKGNLLHGENVDVEISSGSFLESLPISTICCTLHPMVNVFTASTFDAAFDTCQRFGNSVIYSPKQNDWDQFLKVYWSNSWKFSSDERCGDNLWTPFVRANNYFIDKSFVGINGSKVDLQGQWDVGENEKEKLDCVFFNAGTKKLYDEYCYRQTCFICTRTTRPVFTLR